MTLKQYKMKYLPAILAKHIESFYKFTLETYFLSSIPLFTFVDFHICHLLPLIHGNHPFVILFTTTINIFLVA